MDNSNIGTLLQRRRKSVKNNEEETLLILRSYINHPTSWPEILDEVKQNINLLSPAAMEVYNTGSLRQLRDRMSGKLSCLIEKTPADIPDADIRDAIEEIKNNERRLVPRPDPIPEQQPLEQVEAGPADPPRQVVREDIAAALSSDSSEGEQLRQDQTHDPRRRQRKRPLAEIIRENQEAYNRFITIKVPKLM